MANIYVYEASDNLMCVPACLNMVFSRRGLKRVPQCELGYALGLVVPSRLSEQYPDARISDIEEDWGVHPQEPEYSISCLFERLGVPLYFHCFDATHVMSDGVESFLSENLKRGNDIIVSYDYHAVFSAGKNVGHVSLVSDVLSRREEIILVDPESETPVSIRGDALLRGARTVKHGGFWLIGDKKSDLYLMPF